MESEPRVLGMRAGVLWCSKGQMQEDKEDVSHQLPLSPA